MEKDYEPTWREVILGCFISGGIFVVFLILIGFLNHTPIIIDVPTLVNWIANRISS